MGKKPEQKNQLSFLKKSGNWGPIIGVEWIALKFVFPFALLRISSSEIFSETCRETAFDIPGIG